MTMTSQNLLVELLVEELPPKALQSLGSAFAHGIFQGLTSQGLLAEGAQAMPYATPRRLAVHITQVLPQAADMTVLHKLMPVSVGLDAAGQPTAALQKKLQALQMTDLETVLPKLRQESDGKVELLYLQAITVGDTLQQGLQRALESTLSRLPIPKVMSYQLSDGWSSVNFVRPAHGLVALHGNTVVPVSVLGLQAGNTTQAHRFAVAQHTLTIPHADDYAQVLETQGRVMVDFQQRRTLIQQAIQHHPAVTAKNLMPVADAALLDEVTALVEWPNVLCCEFDERFLEVPQECLILTMKANQKYFPLLDPQQKLSHYFLVVSNIEPPDPSAIISGNERVITPRLADAQFFYRQDRQQPLVSRLPGLDKVIYHNQLGSQAERSGRVRQLAVGIAGHVGGDDLVQTVDQAAQLAKCDLLTGMVGEFPELQGVMGGYYARHDGLGDAVAEAIADQYQPRFAGDRLPRSLAGHVLALADKLETLVGMFSIGNVPTGDKDPYALRRHAVGVIRLVMENALPVSLDQLLTPAFALFQRYTQSPDARTLLVSFMFERLSGLLREQGYSHTEIEAVLRLNPQYLQEVPARLQAVRHFSQMGEAVSLAAANKRVANLLKKAQTSSEPVSEKLLQDPAEIALYQVLQQVAPEARQHVEAGRYSEALKVLAALRVPVDHFFDQVMVQVEDEALRQNRVALLTRLHTAMNRVADISVLAIS